MRTRIPANDEAQSDGQYQGPWQTYNDVTGQWEFEEEDPGTGGDTRPEHVNDGRAPEASPRGDGQAKHASTDSPRSRYMPSHPITAHPTPDESSVGQRAPHADSSPAHGSVRAPPTDEVPYAYRMSEQPPPQARTQGAASAYIDELRASQTPPAAEVLAASRHSEPGPATLPEGGAEDGPTPQAQTPAEGPGSSRQRDPGPTTHPKGMLVTKHVQAPPHALRDAMPTASADLQTASAVASGTPDPRPNTPEADLSHPIWRRAAMDASTRDAHRLEPSSADGTGEDSLDLSKHFAQPPTERCAPRLNGAYRLQQHKFEVTDEASNTNAALTFSFIASPEGAEMEPDVARLVKAAAGGVNGAPVPITAPRPRDPPFWEDPAAKRPWHEGFTNKADRKQWRPWRKPQLEEVEPAEWIHKSQEHARAVPGCSLGWMFDANGLPVVSHFPERIARKRGLLFVEGAHSTDLLGKCLAFHVRSPPRTKQRKVGPTIDECPPTSYNGSAPTGTGASCSRRTLSTPTAHPLRVTTAQTFAAWRKKLSGRGMESPGAGITGARKRAPPAAKLASHSPRSRQKRRKSSPSVSSFRWTRREL